jgi:hypothetical protein
MESPAFINAKLNQVNAMSQKDRETWLNDFKMANANDKMTGNPTDFANNYAPVYLNIQTGSDGKATNFEITTGNYDGIVNSTNHSMQSSAGVLDGSVGSSAPLNVHFNMNKTDSQFFTNEINGFNSLYGQDSAQMNLTGSDGDGSGLNIPLIMDGWAAEAQAMPASERTKMVQAAQQMFPGVKWDTDANGNINSFEFAGQVDGPTQCRIKMR